MTTQKKLHLRRETIRTGVRAGIVTVRFSIGGTEGTMGHGASGIVTSPDAPPADPKSLSVIFAADADALSTPKP